MNLFYKLTRNKVFLLLDILLIFGSYAFITLIAHPNENFFNVFFECSYLILATCVIYISYMILFGVYKVYWRCASVKDYFNLVITVFLSGVVSAVSSIFFELPTFYPKLIFITNIMIIYFIVFLRLFVRGIDKLFLLSKNNGGKRTLIIGAGYTSVALLKDIHENKLISFNVVGLIDDDIEKMNRVVSGEKILGNRNDIERICKEKNVKQIIYAINSAEQKEKSAILNICNKTGCKVKIMCSMENMLSDNLSAGNMREIEIEDLLDRDSIKLDNSLISGNIEGKIILLTGGGGSIGSELCRQIIKYKPKKLIILDIYENTTYDLQNELNDNYPGWEPLILIASVRDKKKLNTIFLKYRPNIVFHAAAHKHVPLMENSPSEAIKNNIFGTYNVAQCADEFKADKFILISTDKAVNPTNVMGATKRICEMIVQAMSKRSKTEFVAVRFGNVLGSNGSVIPRFKKQIQNGGPVTVTDPEITRYFMTIPEAAQLVLQATSYARGGEIFILDMGEPVKIYDLAVNMIRLSGFLPEKDIKIKFTGLREGEKLYEELLMEEEGLVNTNHNKIFIGQPIDIDIPTLKKNLELLENCLECDNKEIKRVIQSVVPTYERQDVCFEIDRISHDSELTLELACNN